MPLSLATTGRAILASGLTTISAFGCLLFARYRGFRSMGLAAVIGLAFAVAASVTVLPAIPGSAYPRRRARGIPPDRTAASLSGEGPGAADEG